jgi:hypothetical protein
MIDPVIPHDNPPPITPRTLRQFAGLWIVFVGGFAAFQYYKGNELSAEFFGALALVVGLLGLAVPSSIRPVYSGLMYLTYPIGVVVSYILLSAFFYLVFTPLGLIFKVIGRDPLVLRAPSARESYLIPKASPAGVESYFRQS